MIQLYHIQDAGTDDEPTTFKQRWDLDVCGDEYSVGFRRASNGPIFDRWGGGTMDWDPVFRKPIHIANFEDHGISNEDVLNGRFLDVIREWLVPIRRRIRESAREQGRDLQRRTQDIADEATDFLWREAQRPDAATVIQAHKHNREELAAFERQKQRAAELVDYYMPPEG